MEIKIEELRAQPQQKMGIVFKETLAGLTAVKPVVGELLLAADASGLKVSGRVQTLLKLECDRCLRAYFQSLSVDIDERLVEHLEGQDAPQRELLKGDFVETLPESGILDISDIVYQAVTLAAPSFYLCGPDCPGLPLPDTVSGQVSLGRANGEDNQIDPRWKNLKTLFPKDESDGKS